MTPAQFEVLSNQAVAVAAVAYCLAFLAHLAAWAAARTPKTPARASGRAATDANDDGDVLVMTGDDEHAATSGTGVGAATDRGDLFDRIGLILTVVAGGVHLLAVVTRGLAADPARVPWGNMYEFTLTTTAVVTLVYLVLYRRYGLAWLAPVITGFALVILMVDVLVLYQPVSPLQDALQSPWLVIHVAVAVVATGAFTIGGMASIFYLVQDRRSGADHGSDASVATDDGGPGRLPSAAKLDLLAYRMHAFGFPLWTFSVLIAGPIWAQAAWGRYWGWDPKEVWAFITWVVYAAYLHARATAGWKGRAAAIIALVGLATLWFNFVGINFFFGAGSQHSYA